jgi:hypothetical protein
MPAENFNRIISRAWRIETLSAGIDRSPGLPKERPKQASGRARHRSRPRAGSFRYGGRHYLVMVGGIIPLRRATSSRYDGRLRQESAFDELTCSFAGTFVDEASIESINGILKLSKEAFLEAASVHRFNYWLHHAGKIPSELP